MKTIAKFEKVSLEQYIKDMKKCFGDTYTEKEIKEFYNNIELPTRATKGSAGYDFKTPFELNLSKDKEFLMPTGIRAKIDDGWVLEIYPRSGLGFKYGLQLLNTVGIIDSDYYNSDNEGHIMAKIIYCRSDVDTLMINTGGGFAQGIFKEYGITVDDSADKERNGGFGSTDK